MPPKKRATKKKAPARKRVAKPKVRIGPLRKGTLRQFGYGLYESAAVRHAALVKGVKKLGYATIIRKLNAIAVLNKNRAPAATRVYRSDMAYLRRMFRGGAEGGLMFRAIPFTPYAL